MNCLQLTFMQFFIIAQFPSHGLLRSFHSCLFLKRMHRAPFEVNDRCRRKPAVEQWIIINIEFYITLGTYIYGAPAAKLLSSHRVRRASSQEASYW